VPHPTDRARTMWTATDNNGHAGTAEAPSLMGKHPMLRRNRPHTVVAMTDQFDFVAQDHVDVEDRRHDAGHILHHRGPDAGYGGV
jgi:hypothetical protein